MADSLHVWEEGGLSGLSDLMIHPSYFRRMATICFMGKLFICIIPRVFEGVRVWCCVRVLQRNRANRIFTETQKEIDQEELADEILDADKCSDLPLQAGGPGKPMV